MTYRTLPEVFYHSVDTYRRPSHLKYKRDGRWQDVSSDEFRRAVEEAAMGLRALGFAPGDKAAILSENRPEWAFADLATLCAAGADVPIYGTLPPGQILYILNDSEAKVLFVSTPAQARKIAEIRDQAPHLQHVIRFDPDAVLPGSLTLDELREKGRPALAVDPNAVRVQCRGVAPDDVATLIYTTGTTGDHKGVMLTHDNLVSNVKGSIAVFGAMGPDDVALSFLPLCHSFERMGGHYLMLAKGVTIAYAEGVEQVPANMAEVRPTLMLSVPRLYEKMFARINERVAADSPFAQAMFRWAMGVGRERFRCRVEGRAPGLLLSLQHAVADALVFAKVRARVGGRLRLFVSGGAPLSKEIAEFFGAAGLIILEGYGLTETSPVITVNRPETVRPGTVGKPLQDVEVRIAEDGEILARGPNIMKGYYKKPEATAETIDREGWFHTGDIGVLEDGFLRITDRKKDIIVTSGGKNIAPQPIENTIRTHPLVGEIVMIGNQRNFAAALLVPNFERLESWAREKGVRFASREDLIGLSQVQDLYDGLVRERTKDLAQFEKIKKVALLSREFTLEGGELTPTLKVKRRVVEKKYQDLIDRMYEGPAA